MENNIHYILQHFQSLHAHDNWISIFKYVVINLYAPIYLENCDMQLKGSHRAGKSRKIKMAREKLGDSFVFTVREKSGELCFRWLDNTINCYQTIIPSN